MNSSFLYHAFGLYRQECTRIEYKGDPTKAKTQLGWNPQTTSFEQLVQIMVKHDMEKVAADHVASVMRTNLAEYLEKGIVK